MNRKKVLMCFLLFAILFSIYYFYNLYCRQNDDDFFLNSNHPALVININHNSPKVNTGIIKANSVNCRTKPWGKVAAILKKGDIVGVKFFENDWYVIDYNGEDLYVHSKYLDVEGNINNSPDNGILKKEAELTDNEGKTIGKLNKDEKIVILFDASKYWKIKYNDVEAFILKSAVNTQI